MWNSEKNHQGREFLTPPAKWRNFRDLPAMPISERRPRRSPQPRADSFHVIHKVPAGDSPYVKAKHVQLIEKDPSRAISLFWASINAGDRVESALKDMAVVMKQLDRSEEAIEAIKSFRHLCPHESQDSLDNVLLELYKSSDRIQEEIELLQLKLKRIEEDMAFGGKQSKIARSQGRKVQITVEKEYSRLLGNLAWVFMQQKDYKSAEEYYRKALSLEPDKNKQCNLAICLIHMNKIVEARFLLRTVQFSADCGADESYAKSFERAVQMINEIEPQSTSPVGTTRIPRNKSFRCNTTGSVVFDSRGNRKAVAYESSPSIFTQPRRRLPLQVSSSINHGGEVQTSSTITGSCMEDNGDHYSRELSFEQQPLVPLEPLPLEGGGVDCPQGPCNLRRSLELREIVRTSMENLKAVQHLDESPTLAPHILEREGTKKSWADMVEEDDEQEKDQCVEKYDQRMPLEQFSFCRTPDKFSECFKHQQLNDEKADSNVVVDTDPSVKHNEPTKKDAERTETAPVDDPGRGGYYTQPANYVRRSLTFHDQQPQNAAAENRRDLSSPQVQEALNVDTYASVLTGGGCSNPLEGGVGVKRLKVFRDITP